MTPLFVWDPSRNTPPRMGIDRTNTDLVRNITQNAYVKGYARFTVTGKDYPAIAKDSDGVMDGLLLIPQNRSQRVKLDDFEGETYKVERVAATVVHEGGDSEQVDADIYVWDGELKDVSRDRCDLGKRTIGRLVGLVRWSEKIIRTYGTNVGAQETRKEGCVLVPQGLMPHRPDFFGPQLGHV